MRGVDPGSDTPDDSAGCDAHSWVPYYESGRDPNDPEYRCLDCDATREDLRADDDTDEV